MLLSDMSLVRQPSYLSLVKLPEGHLYFPDAVPVIDKLMQELVDPEALLKRLKVCTTYRHISALRDHAPLVVLQPNGDLSAKYTCKIPSSVRALLIHGPSSLKKGTQDLLTAGVVDFNTVAYAHFLNKDFQVYHCGYYGGEEIYPPLEDYQENGPSVTLITDSTGTAILHYAGDSLYAFAV